MRVREMLGPSPKRESGVPRVDTVEEAVKLTNNGTPHVMINGSPEPHKPSSVDATKPQATDPGNINDETILTDTGELPVEKLTGFLEGKISNPNLKSPEGNDSAKGK